MRNSLLLAVLGASLATGCNGSSSPPVTTGQGADAGASRDAASACASEGVSCATASCCAGQALECMTDPVSGSVCRLPCTSDADCSTGCCDPSTGYCHDSLYCNCVDAGVCASGGPNCCPGTTCMTYQADGGGASCYTNCTKSSDCATGCCSQNVPGLAHGVCGPC